MVPLTIMQWGYRPEVGAWTRDKDWEVVITFHPITHSVYQEKNVKTCWATNISLLPQALTMLSMGRPTQTIRPHNSSLKVQALKETQDSIIQRWTLYCGYPMPESLRVWKWQISINLVCATNVWGKRAQLWVDLVTIHLVLTKARISKLHFILTIC